jgi:hypothetical protein
MAKKANNVVPVQQVENLIYLIRGQKVMLDSDLAALYGVEARILNQSVKRNMERFPEDFMFRLSVEEAQLVMRSQIVTASPKNSSQFVTSSKKHRGLSYRPYAFTEQGIAMLSSVLRSPRAVKVNIEVMRAFVKLRQWLSTNAELARRLDALESKYDEQFKIVFDAIRELMTPNPVAEQRSEMGFHAVSEKPKNKNRLSKALA